MGPVLDEAVINTPWGGGWLVAVVRAGKTAMALAVSCGTWIIQSDILARPIFA
jgi:hypothetical protein